MSRIHQAMQRAAEQSGNATSAATVESPAVTSDDFVDVGLEAFPIELSERRRPRVATVTPAPVASAPPAPLRERSGADEPNTKEATPHPSQISFERNDSPYAGKIVLDEQVSAASREQYRRLAAGLHQAQGATGIRVVMLTSAIMGEGKTLTASNLALTLSESYQKQVLLIDADLRRPALHSVFKLPSVSGLSESLIEDSDCRIPVQQISSRLGILTAGRPTADPIAGLTSPRMRRLLTEARQTFDWIILDTPPVAMLPDASLLTSMVDGAVLVVRAGSTPWDLVQRAVAAIGKERTLGIVLNSVTAREGGAGYYDYHSSEEETGAAT